MAIDKESSGDLAWLATLRGLGTVAIVILHSAADIVIEYPRAEMTNWWIANIVDSACRLGVPLFLMISGALLLPRTYDNVQFLKKRALRILPPFVFWSIVYVFYNYLTKLNTPGEYLKQEFFLMYKSGSYYHLWYIFSLVGIYLFMPLISTWLRNSSARDIRIYLYIWLGAMFLYSPLTEPYLPDLELRYFSGNIGYCILGYYLTVHVPVGAQWKRRGVFFYCVGVLTTACGTYIVSEHKGALNEWFYAIASPSVALSGIGIFIWMRNSTWSSGAIGRRLAALSTYSYGIYLSHALILSFMENLNFDPSQLGFPLISIPLVSTICLSVSFGMMYVLRRLPFGKWTTG